MNRFLLLVLLFLPTLLLAQEPVIAPAKPRVAYEFSEKTVAIVGSRVVRAGDSASIFIELDSALWPIVELPIEINGQSFLANLDKGMGELRFPIGKESESLVVKIQDYETKLSIPVVNFPLWLAILPPLLAILLALILKEVFVSLFLGIFVGATVLAVSETGSWTSIGSGLLASLDTYIIHALHDSDHLAIIVFSLLIGGMVAIISRNGGMQGIVNRLSKLAKSPKSGQMATYLMGLVIFFDDYANTLVVGNTMRPVTDKLRISREKLSYLVDSTAAPVAALAFVTTWIGAELGYISDGIDGLRGFPTDQSPYLIFLNSLSYSFYPMLTLLFIPMLILTGRDFGPMLKAERRARSTGQVSRLRHAQTEDKTLDEFSPLPGVVPKARYALIPVLVLVFGVLLGLVSTGYSADIWQHEEMGLVKKLSETIGNANSYSALLWASLCSLITAIFMSMIGRRLKLLASMESMLAGFKAMMGAVVILTLAWALSGITKDMHTAGFLTDLLGRDVSPVWIPALSFLLSALVAFSTGSSWSTMAILFPIMVPLVWEASRSFGLAPADSLPLLYNTVASVLAGSVLGDHISPISDTTILSSLASNCDHIDHVRTQIPYAMVVGGVALVFGVLPTGLGLPAWLSMILCLVFLGLVVWRIGRPVEQAPKV
ncbi:MAG: Na+/H+ antiporter NhaC family protein [Bacteroidia bacterium]|nr:Na+/H+ antiporter NhaC family protein [Bacteroidia bacterium]